LVEVRSALPADAEAIADLKVRSWRAAYTGLLPAELLDALDPSREAEAWRDYIEAKPEVDRLWLAVDQEVCGFARTGPSPYPDLPERSAEVHGLYVDPERIGTGIGRLLLEHAVADLQARGYGTVTLWHFVGNERAGRFYEIAGFVADGAIRSSDFGVDEVRLRRGL
jgi:GNAT superfamily N-acetyltransferase